jgi:hypothetical protein
VSREVVELPQGSKTQKESKSKKKGSQTSLYSTSATLREKKERATAKLNLKRNIILRTSTRYRMAVVVTTSLLKIFMKCSVSLTRPRTSITSG